MGRVPEAKRSQGEVDSPLVSRAKSLVLLRTEIELGQTLGLGYLNNKLNGTLLCEDHEMYSPEQFCQQLRCIQISKRHAY